MKPVPTKCGECGHWAAVFVCTLCKTPRPIFGLLRALTVARPSANDTSKERKSA